MNSCTTKGISISVESFYNEKHSDPNKGQFVHSYQVSIVNNSKHTVQLIRRHWIIVDSLGPIREVEGEGVIGEQPVLSPGGKHEYTSWCPMKTEIGKMSGTYQMYNLDLEEAFFVTIPEFRLIANARLN
ncbi:MAG: Co2+/Mg2+ efflux protein ApaG [Bacteroidota bacterium]